MVELRSSVTDRALVIASPGLLVVLGAMGVRSGGLWTPGAALVVAGVALWAVAAWSVPWLAQAGTEGVTIRTLIRSQAFPWDDVVALERHRRRPGGPLVLRTVERRRVALSTSVELPAQWDGLRELIRDHAPGVALADPPPLHPFSRDR